MQRKAQLALISASFFWAISFIATKVALNSAPALTVVTLRLIISSFCFVIWLIFSGRKIEFLGFKWLAQLFLLSLYGTGLHYGIQTIGLKYTSASNASLYAVTAPITILILGAIILKERVGLKKLTGIALALSGVLTVMGLDTLLELELKKHLLGDFLVFCSIVFWGLFTVFGKKMTDQLGPLKLTALVTFIGSLTMLPVGALECYYYSFSLSKITIDGWLAIIFLGTSCSFLATLLYFYALRYSQSQKVGVYLYTIPPMTAVVAYFYLNETLGLNFFLGSLLVIAGVYLTEKG